MDSKDLIQKRVLSAFEGIDVDLFLFGSRATGKTRDKSDFDIGYWTEALPSARILAELKDDLAEMPISQHVDLVDFARVPETFKDVALQNVEIMSPRQAIRAAYDLKIINDIEIWFQFLENRNLTSHTYQQAQAESVYATAARFPDALKRAVSEIRRKYPT